MKQTYAVVFEQTSNNYCAYVPDLPGCISTGKTWKKIEAMIREAIALHIEGTLEDGGPLPQPKMSIDDAIAYHNEPMSDYARQSFAEFGGPPASLSVTFEMVEVEVSLAPAATES